MGKTQRQHSMGGAARISMPQLLFLAVTLHFTAAELIVPTSLAQVGHSGGWVAPFAGWLVSGLPVSLLVGSLVRRFPGQGFGEMATKLVGGLLGRLLTLLLSLFSLVLTSLTVRDVVELIPVAILPATPVWAVALPFMLVVVYGSYSGAEVLARMSIIYVAAQAGILVLGLVTLVGLISPLRLLPLYDQDPLQILRASWPSIGWFGEAWSFLSFAALVDRAEKAGSGLALGAALAAVFLALFTALAIAVFGHDLASHFTFAIYSLVQQISIGEFVERLDVFLVSIWLVGMLIKAASHLWLSVNGAAFTLGLKNERYLGPLLAAAALGIMNLVPNLPAFVRFSTMAWTPISYGLGLGIPGLLLIASWVREYRNRSRRGVGA